MSSLWIALLTALVLALSGTVVILARRLRAAERGGETGTPRAPQPEPAQAAVLRKQRERAARLCMDMKRSLTQIHTTVPSAIPGLSVERIRLLCAEELKDRVNAALHAIQNGFPDRLAQSMDERDFARLDERIGRLASISADVRQTEEALAPLWKAWSPDCGVTFDAYEQKLTEISRRLEELCRAVQALLYAVSEKQKTGETVLPVRERVRQTASLTSDPEVRAALADLETLVQQHYDSLDRQTKARMESYYLQTLELVLGELGRAERTGEDTDAKARLSIRVIQVLSHVLTAGQRAQSELRERSLEAEVVALERLAALRDDNAQGGLKNH